MSLTSTVMKTDGGLGTTVLVVDDEPGVADLYAAWLKSDFSIRVAYGGEEALEMLDESVDVVIVDRRMPDVTGDDIVGEVKARGLDCLVAMVTAVEPDVDIIGVEFDDYLTKPVSQDDLLGSVRSLLVRKQYDAGVTELFSLLTKRVRLEETLPATELADSEEYQGLLDRISVLEAEVEVLSGRLDTSNPAALFRHLGDGEDGAVQD